MREQRVPVRRAPSRRRAENPQKKGERHQTVENEGQDARDDGLFGDRHHQHDVDPGDCDDVHPV
ncbi:hypothetical protein [Methyloversatilis sp. RAC08]|uniref:hypothetical protein n=1 Tax=Methyloversatilis sp. RAC08 TaxID=1842540 RepID=UPI00083D5A0A|nr:hypothetical protein [Methyloversatilis sp. RAC08]